VDETRCGARHPNNNSLYCVYNRRWKHKVHETQNGYYFWRTIFGRWKCSV
jgi:hypothetical protein